MNKENKFMNNLILHIRYPYTALIIAIMWIGMAIIISSQQTNIELLITLTSISTLIIAIKGFKLPK